VRSSATAEDLPDLPFAASRSEPVELQVMHQLAHDLGVLAGRVAVPFGPMGEAETRAVHRHAAEAVT